ncbi:hypothetical protein Scep_001931 [Stephania cephalantha]|uniref:Uncharacterized protein n=1 Tax=Stephania cephalantha TaxID=152367 RepID=A0AAP0LBR8_9MAGN
MYTPPHPLIMLTSLSRHYLTSPSPSRTLSHTSLLLTPHTHKAGRRRNREEEEEERRRRREGERGKTGVEELRRPKSGVGHVSRDVSETLECVLRS